MTLTSIPTITQTAMAGAESGRVSYTIVSSYVTGFQSFRNKYSLKVPVEL